MKKCEIEDVENTKLKKIWSRLETLQNYHNSKIICKGTYYLSRGKEYFIPIKYAKIDMSEKSVIDFLIIKQSKGLGLVNSLELLLKVKTGEVVDSDWGCSIKKKLVKFKILRKGEGVTEDLSLREIEKLNNKGILIKNIFYKEGEKTPIVGYNSLHIKEYSRLLAEAKILKDDLGF